MVARKKPAKKAEKQEKRSPKPRAGKKDIPQKRANARKVGRPSTYSEALADQICEGLASGKSLRQICAAKDMPDRTTVDRWAEAMPEFAAKRARAREAQADTLFDGMAEIEEKTLARKLDPKIARVVLSSQQWRAAKLAPKKYGEKVTQELTGANGGPIETRELSDTERAVRVAAFMANRPKKK